MAFTMQLPERHATSLAGSRLTVGSWDLRRSPPLLRGPAIRPLRPGHCQWRWTRPARPGHWQGPRLGRSPPAYGAGLRLPENLETSNLRSAARARRGAEAE